MENFRLEIDVLINILNNATVEYDKGTPIMSDEEWNLKYFHLLKLEKNFNYFREDSPTQKVYFKTISELDKSKHEYPMLSLDKTTSVDDLIKFTDHHRTILSLKMDGLSCALTYENGKLVLAETRGNGEVGEDITNNAFAVKNIPNRIPIEDRLVIHGEIISTYENLERFPEYNNPRNFAAGSIRLLDSEESHKRGLSFVAWDVVEGFEKSDSVSNKLEKISKYFEIVPYVIYDSDEVDMETIIFRLDEESKVKSYPIDGIVCRYDSIEYGQSLGMTTHHPKHSIAYKFMDESYISHLINIEWNPSKNGRLTPVAIFEPIVIDGTVVERASLSNLTVMEETLGIPYVGEEIHVIKSKKIIPQIIDAEKISFDECVENSDDYELIYKPKVCPICGHATMEIDTPTCTHLACSNSNCGGILIEQLENFVGKKGLDIKGLSRKTMEKLNNWGWLDSKVDVFKLKDHKTEWIAKPGFGTASVNKILKSIEESKTTTLDKFLASLGIPLIGGNVAKEVAKLFNSYPEFREAIDNKYKFYNINGFGYEKSNSLWAFDYSEADEIYKYLNMAAENGDVANTQALDGLTFVITGKLKRSSRAALQSHIESNGGKVSGSVSSKTSYLINNDTTSETAKNLKAKSFGIPIISEQEFYETMLQQF